MKKLFVLLLIVFTTVCYSQTNYVRGFENGYKEGYCHDKGIGCIEPIPPTAPIPKIGESSGSYNDGYNRGFEMGLQANNNSSQTQQSGSSHIVHDYGEPQSMFDTDLAIYALAAKQRRYNGQVQNNKNRKERKKLEKINKLVDEAISDQKKGRYQNAAYKLYQSYQLSKNDVVYLYYAATNAVLAKDYHTALRYYNEFMEVDSDDTAIKSKKGEVAKNIVLIYIQQNKLDLAKEAMKKAKAENPNDVGLLKTEANMYYSLGNVGKYNQLMKEIVKKDPDNATLYYNLAVSSAELGDTKDAIEYYKKTIELDPKMESAYFNLAATILQKEKGILEEMNKALSDGNNSKYDELGSQRKDLYKQVLPYLEKALTINPKNEGVISTMINIYYVLGEKSKADKLKEKL